MAVKTASPVQGAVGLPLCEPEAAFSCCSLEHTDSEFKCAFLGRGNVVHFCLKTPNLIILFFYRVHLRK